MVPSHLGAQNSLYPFFKRYVIRGQSYLCELGNNHNIHSYKWNAIGALLHTNALQYHQFWKLCLQAASIIGHMILAMPCKVEACGKRKAKTETKSEEWNGTEGSSTKVTPLSSEEECNILQKILQWLDEKDRAEEIKDQWFDIAAVLDRLAFIAMLAISIYVNWHVIHGVKNMA